MNIIYPMLVEQSYQFMQQQGIEVSKAEVYQMMVREGIVTQTGEPTKKAVGEGLVTSYQKQHSTLKEFKKEYPLFRKYPVKEFTQQDGIWYVSQKIIEEITDLLQSENSSYDELQQVTTYFNFRNYENPHHSIAEIKGVYHPLYTPYPDELFQVVDGQVAIPKSVMEDILLRCKNGELEVTDEQYQGFKALLENLED